ncbi:MAG: hypothetical protein Q9162_005272 [Coniocarpon cinnabarinum]
MSTKRILITGGSGFLGIAIIKQLSERHPNWDITIADLDPPSHDIPNHKDINYVSTDVKVPQQCLDAVRRTKPDLVIHTAGRVPGGLTRYSHAQRNRDDLFPLNIGGTQNMLDAAKAYGTPNFLFTGSCTSITDDLDHEYPNFNENVPYPAKSLIYGASKAAAEKLVLEANSASLATCSLKPSTILGDQDYQLVPSIHACIAKYETPFVIGNGDNLYDFTHVTNVGYAHALAAENLFTTKTCAGQAILISNDQPITFRDFCLAIWAQFDHVPPFSVVVPARLAWLVGGVAELWARMLGGKTTLCRGSVGDAIGTRYADLTKARELLGFEPIVDMWDGVALACRALKRRMERAKVDGVATRRDGWGHAY